MNLPLGEGALVFGMVYNFLPFMIYPIYNTLQKMDHNLIEAAQDLGASPTRVFGKVILPLSMPGVMSGIVRRSMSPDHRGRSSHDSHNSDPKRHHRTHHTLPGLPS